MPHVLNPKETEIIMKLFDWILPKPETATVPELEAQLEAAKQSHREATEKVEEEAAAFDLDPSKEAVLLKAQEAVARCQAHVDRAERLLKAGREREAAKNKIALTKKEKELEKQLEEQRAKARNELPERVAELLLEVAKAQGERLAHNQLMNETERELSRVKYELSNSGHEGDFHSIAARVESGRPSDWIGVPLQIFKDELQKIAVAKSTDDYTYQGGRCIREEMKR